MLNKFDFVNSTEVDQFIDFLRKEVFSSASQLQQYIDDYKWPENKNGLNFELGWGRATPTIYGKGSSLLLTLALFFVRLGLCPDRQELKNPAVPLEQ